MSGRRNLIVSKRQRGNPLLQHLKTLAYEYEDIKPDYVTGATTCILFLSMRYHRLHPEYIYNRIGKLGKDFELRVLLVQADIENPAETLQDLMHAAIVHDLALVVAWSAEEAASYVRAFKSKDGAGPKAIQAQHKSEYVEQLVEVMTKVPNVNRTDALSAVLQHGSFREVVKRAASVDQLEGWGPTKSNRFKQAVEEPFKAQDPFGRYE